MYVLILDIHILFLNCRIKFAARVAGLTVLNCYTKFIKLQDDYELLNIA